MAVTALTNNVINKLNEWVEIETAAAAASTAADGVTVDFSSVKDCQVLILATNGHESAAKTVTVKGGNGQRGSQDLDAKSIAAGDTYGIVLDSAYFVDETGTSKGKVKIIPASTDITFQVFVMPY